MCALKSDRPKGLSREQAETLAIRAIGFLAEDAGRLNRFLALTGMKPQGLIAGAETAPVQAAVLDHLLQDESLLMVFSGHAGLAPEAVSAARALLEGPHQGSGA
jgi:hypothetical protein